MMRALRDPNLAEESILFILVLEYREINSVPSHMIAHFYFGEGL
jgi:hypothetical protein